VKEQEAFYDTYSVSHLFSGIRIRESTQIDPKIRVIHTMSTNNNIQVEGYPRLAKVMGPRDLGIFRKFAELNALNVLHLQAELVYLEEEFKILTELDETSGDPARPSCKKCVCAS
jgi:hypothetical protein